MELFQPSNYTIQSSPTDLKGVAAKNGVGLIFAKTVQYKLRVKVIEGPATIFFNWFVILNKILKNNPEGKNFSPK